MLHLSQYCEVIKDTKTFLWHKVYGNPLIISNETWELLRHNEFTNIDTEEKKLLLESKFIVEKEPSYVDIYKQIDQEISKYNDLSLIKTGFVIVTNSCNLNCAYCMFRDVADKKQKNLSIDQFMTAIDKIIHLHTRKDPLVITFSGGEPLLQFDFIKNAVSYLTRSYSSLKFEFRILTNATLLNDNIVDFLQKNDFRVHLSIDGLADEHARIRTYSDSNKQTSFSGIELAANYARQKKINVEAIQVTLCDGNFDITPVIFLSWIKDNFNIDKIAIEPDITHKTTKISPVDMARKIKEFVVIGEKMDIEITGFTLKPYFSLFEHFLDRKRLAWCGAILGSGLVVTPENKWKSCAYLDETHGELESKIDQVRTNWLQWQKKQITTQRQQCYNCKLEFLCMGGCLVSQKNKDAFRYRCELYKLTFDLMLQEHLKRE